MLPRIASSYLKAGARRAGEDGGTASVKVRVAYEDTMKVNLPDGTQKDIEDRDIVEEKTPWNTLKLDDGTILKIRLNVTGVQRVLDAWDPVNGSPSYFVQHAIAIRVRAPPKLKAKELHKTDTQEAKEVA